MALLALLIAIGLLGYAAVGVLLPRVVWPALAASAGWAFYAWIEWALVGPDTNIRIDLCLIAPVLIVLTLWAFFAPALAPKTRSGEKRSTWSRVNRS